MSSGDVFDSDTNWVKLMNNRVVIKDLVEHICHDKKAVFGGAALIASPDFDVKALVDPFTVDIITPKIYKTKKISKADLKELESENSEPQKIYKSISAFFQDHDLVENKINIFLFSDLYGDDPVNSTAHWATVIVNMPTKTYFWYDPSAQVDGKNGYDFSSFKKKSILENFPDLRDVSVLPMTRAQQYFGGLGQDHRVTDIFCQSWTLMFLSAYLDNAVEYFFSLDFKKHQMEIIKSFLISTIKSMPDYNYKWLLKDKRYKLFFTRVRKCVDRKCKVEKIKI